MSESCRAIIHTEFSGLDPSAEAAVRRAVKLATSTSEAPRGLDDGAYFDACAFPGSREREGRIPYLGTSRAAQAGICTNRNSSS